MNVGPVIERLLAGERLLFEEAAEIMRFLISGEATEAQIAGFLIAFKTDNPRADELAGFVAAMRETGVRVKHDVPIVVDSCGTGGGIPSFNISTAAAIVAAAAGAKVAKHGNRAVTSSCGSADVFEALGARLDVAPERQSAILKEVGLIFMFAPNYYPAMRHVGPARRQLGTRTVFNILGPLANPARANRQLIGVFDGNNIDAMGIASLRLGSERVALVHSEDGMDEISPCGITDIHLYSSSDITTIWQLSPDSWGGPVPESALASGADVAENAAIVREAINDANSDRCRAILPSAGALLWLAELAESIEHGVAIAAVAVASGRASRLLDAFIEATNAD